MTQPQQPSLAAASRLTWWKLGLAVLSGLLVYLCFPPADLGPLAWIALIPLFLALTQVRAPAGLVLGLVFGFTFMGLCGSFMLNYGRFPWFATIGFETLFLGLFGFAGAACNRSPHPAVRALGVAAAWTLAEMLRGGIGALGFTLGDLGYTQHDTLPILQAASMVGHYGLGFFIALLNAAVAQAVLALAPGIWVRPAIHPRQFAQLAARTALGGYILILLIYLWGALVLNSARAVTDEHMLEAAVVQGVLGDSEDATEEDARVAHETYLTLSRTIPESVDLIVWPEVAVPMALNLAPDLAEELAEFAEEKSAWLVTGAFELADGRVYNTLYLFSPEGQQTETYRKVILVPFGECVPMRERFPWLARFTLRDVDFSPGERHRLLHLGEYSAGPLICFEGLFPHAVRANTRLGADLIILATSDAWAAGTPEIEQHSVTAPARAVEARRYVVRAGTWGRSQVVTPWGEVLADVPVAQPGTAWAEVAPREELSAYHRWGDTPLLIACVLFMLAGWLGLPRVRHRDESDARGASQARAEEEG